MRRLFAVLALGSPVLLLAHGGGLDANGCHTNRKTGDYHCHRASSPPPPRPVSTFADQSASGGRQRASSGAVYYRNCTEVRAAGAAPLRVGEPGYARHLDRDGDGVACEPYRR